MFDLIEEYDSSTKKEIEQRYIASEKKVKEIKQQVNLLNNHLTVLNRLIQQYYPNGKPSSEEDPTIVEEQIIQDLEEMTKKQFSSIGNEEEQLKIWKGGL